MVKDHLHFVSSMAYLRIRADRRVEIRESVSTAAGPRARTLATFRGSLGPDVLEQAAGRASRGFDGRALVARARELGIPVTERRKGGAARQLLGRIRQGVSLDPVLVTLLREALARCPAAEVPAELHEAADWVGVDVRRRGQALRGLLRTTDRIVRTRPQRRAKPRQVFPRFRSTPEPSAP